MSAYHTVAIIPSKRERLVLRNYFAARAPNCHATSRVRRKQQDQQCSDTDRLLRLTNDQLAAEMTMMVSAVMPYPLSVFLALTLIVALSSRSLHPPLSYLKLLLPLALSKTVFISAHQMPLRWGTANLLLTIRCPQPSIARPCLPFKNWVLT